MVSFRFHIVSLVAVFLALGLGVLVGTTVLNRGIIAQLENQQRQLEKTGDQNRAVIDSLRAQEDAWTAFGEQAMEPLLAGRLTGREVIIVKGDGADAASVDGVQAALRESGAEVPALLSVTGRMALDGEADRIAMSRIVGGGADDGAGALSALAARDLADGLALEEGSTLEALLDEGFVVNEGPGLDEADLESLGGANQSVVVVAGGPAPSRVDPPRFLVPLVDELARQGFPVAAGEPFAEDGEPSLVELLRSDGEVSGRIATQDNVDQLPGQISLVVALEDLLETDAGGHYGVKEGATQPIAEM